MRTRAMRNHALYVTRLFDAVSRASGNGVRWVLQVSGADTTDAPPTIILTRIANGRTSHMFSDSFQDMGIQPLAKGRIMMRKDMLRGSSWAQPTESGDRVRERIMGCIRDYNTRLKRSPSLSEIGRVTGITPNGVKWHLHVLSQRGKVECVPGKAYGIILKEGIQ